MKMHQLTQNSSCVRNWYRRRVKKILIRNKFSTVATLLWHKNCLKYFTFEFILPCSSALSWTSRASSPSSGGSPDTRRRRSRCQSSCSSRRSERSPRWSGRSKAEIRTTLVWLKNRSCLWDFVSFLYLHPYGLLNSLNVLWVFGPEHHGPPY